MLSPAEAVAQFKEISELRGKEKARLDKIRRYLRDDPQRPLEGLPSTVPPDVRKLARLARVNVLKFAVNSRVQAMYVDGYRTGDSQDDSPAWKAWQANGWDARQIGVHRAALSYGAGYATVTPGDPYPVIRAVSPREMTAVYGDDDMWPSYAVEQRRNGWRLYDRTHVYTFGAGDEPDYLGDSEHGAKYMGEQVCPVVRYRDTIDLDEEAVGVVEPLLVMQDQINITTFGLLVAQHFGAFKFRYILGWTANTEEERIKASASNFFTLDEDPNSVQIGQLDETDLKGYIDARDDLLEILAAIAQLPAHELTGKLVNLSAEALAAAEAGKRRAITEHKTVMGESHEQMLGLVGEYGDVEADPSAYVRWQDTEARALSQLVDALGKAVQMLGIPAEMLWDRVADALGASQQEVEAWKKYAAENPDPLAGLTGFLGGQPA